METAEKSGQPRPIETTDLAGGHPALDFVNSVGGLRSTGPLPEDELLRSYEDLVQVGLKTGTLPERAARRLRAEAKKRPSDASAALETALDTRALIDSVFRPLSEGEAPPPDALAALRDLGADAIARASLVPDRAAAGHLHYAWENEADDLEAPLWPLAQAALELATHGPLEKLKGCGRCRWLFLDTTKNHSRRWCSMEECGTHEKMERYVERRRARRRAAER